MSSFYRVINYRVQFLNKSFTLQRRQTADELPLFSIRLADEIGGVLVLARAFRTGNVLLHELIYALPIEDCVMI